MKRSVLVVVGLLVLGAVSLAAPRIIVSPETHDFGTVVDGDVVEFSLLIENAGDAPLESIRVQPSCGCTSAPLPRNRLLPGESVAVMIRFGTANYSQYPQPTGTTVSVYSSDPSRPRVVVQIQGTVLRKGSTPPRAAHEGTAREFESEFYVLVDLRPVEAYAQGHLMGALSIPFTDLLARMGELPRDRVAYLYDETGIQSVQAAQLLRQSGFLSAWAVRGGLSEWWRLYGDLYFAWAPDAVRASPTGVPYYGTFAVVEPNRVARGHLYIVDIRSREVFVQGRFLGSANVQLGTQDEIAAWATTLPGQAPSTALAIWIVDEDGSRAAPIAQYLQGLGFTKARALLGGVAAWRATYGDTLLFPSR